jgi:hypothetical protein
MDYSEPKSKRTKKSDKAKKNFEINGTFTKKHIRISEAAKKTK